jgi:polysaccharide biosynthesis protein PslH
LNILFLTQVLPYPQDAGPKIRSYKVLRYLAQNHQIYLVSFIRSTDSKESLDHLRSYCKEVIAIPLRRSRLQDTFALGYSFFNQLPFLINRDNSARMSKALKQLAKQERFDAVHSDQLWMAPYALLTRRLAKSRGYTPRLVLDQHNAVFQVPRRMAEQPHNSLVHLFLAREARLMAHYEVQTCQNFDRVVWVTEEDRQAVRAQSSVGNFQTSVKSEEKDWVIPICIDPTMVEQVELQEGSQEILFLGGMHWPPNADGIRWFANAVFPLVKEECPGAKLVVVGKKPPEDLREIDGVTLTGYVDDPQVYWKKSRVFIVPLNAAGGMRVKILDAWGHAVPVVSTTIGAEGIHYNEGKELLIADDPSGLAKAVVSLLLDAGLARQIGSAGRAALGREYDWRKIYQAWDEVYAN